MSNGKTASRLPSFARTPSTFNNSPVRVQVCSLPTLAAPTQATHVEEVKRQKDRKEDRQTENVYDLPHNEQQQTVRFYSSFTTTLVE